MNVDLSYHELEIECPNCGHIVTVLYKQVMSEETVICSGCLHEIQLVDEGNAIKRVERDVNNGIQKLQDTLNKLGK